MDDFSVKKQQIAALERMLNLNPGTQTSSFWEEVWKVLIYDQRGSDIIAPLFHVGELRKQGITLNMLLHSDRKHIPDVPAIYFVQPSRENIKRIAEDVAKNLYDSYYLNFISSLSRPLMEELAAETLKSGSVNMINQVYDQYLSFISLEDNFFTLGLKNSYIAVNDPTITDADAEKNVELIVDCLFSVLLTIDTIPIIRCPANGAAEMVAHQLDQRLREYIHHSSNFAESKSMSSMYDRPVLVLLDRNVDLRPMLSHSWTYQALVHDLLGIQLNRVTVEVHDDVEEDKSQSAKRVKTYDLNKTADFFWRDHTGSSFPTVATEVKKQYDEYAAAKSSISNMVDEGEDVDSLVEKTRALGQFVGNSLNELREKKRIIDIHTNVVTALLNVIQAREIFNYVSVEQAISKNTKDVSALITEYGPGEPNDKLRLFLLYYMTHKNISNSDLKEFERVFESLGRNLDALSWINKMKTFYVSTQASSSTSSTKSVLTSFWGGRGSDVMQRSIYSVRDLFSAVQDQTMAYLMPSKQRSKTTQIVNALMENTDSVNLNIENYLYFDPKVPATVTQVPRKNTPFSRAIVFMVGGGNYHEYQNLVDHINERKKVDPEKHIIYGCTELVSPNEFLQQLEQLGQACKKP